MTKNMIRQLQAQQAERHRALGSRLFGIFSPDPIADAWLAAIAADPTVKDRLTTEDRASLDAYAKARDEAQKDGDAA